MNKLLVQKRTSVIVALLLVAMVLLSTVLPVVSVRAASYSATVIKITADTNLMPQAGTSGTAVGKLYTDSTYPREGEALGSDGKLWYKIRYNASSSAWVSSAGAQKVSVSCSQIYADASSLTRLVTPTGNVTLRSGAGSNYPAVCTTGKEHSYVVVDDGDAADGVSWFKVQCGNLTGWISRKSVSIANLYSNYNERKFSAQNPPVIYLSPSNQTGNPYSYGGTNESAQMTRVANALKAILENTYNCKVYVAEQSMPISKAGRPTDAYNKKADIYLAIHSNAANGSSRGSQAYYFAGNAQCRNMGIKLVERMESITPWQGNVTSLINGMSYLDNYGYGEVRNPGALGMIAMLFETEYHDNATTAKWITENTNAMAQAIADGLNDTFSFPLKGSGVQVDPIEGGSDDDDDNDDNNDNTEEMPPEIVAASALKCAENEQPDVQAIIKKLAPICTYSMNRTGIAASVAIAQAMLDSDMAQNESTQQYSNLYGMTEHMNGAVWESDWTAPVPQQGDEQSEKTEAVADVTQTAAQELSEDTETAAEQPEVQQEQTVQDEQEPALDAVPENDSAEQTQTPVNENAEDTQEMVAEPEAEAAQSEQPLDDAALADALRAYSDINAAIYDHNAYLAGACIDGTPIFKSLAYEKDYKKAANIIAQALYSGDEATQYADNLCSFIEQYELTQYDKWNIPAQSVAISASAVTIKRGDTATLSANVTPAVSTDKIVWSSNNTAVASVSSDGKVKGVADGTAVITAKAGKKSVKCTVEVVPNIGFRIMGVSIRLAEPYGLRFGVELKKDNALAATNVVEYGTLIIPQSYVTGGELTINTPTVSRVPADKIYSEDAEKRVFTGVLVKVPKKSFPTPISGRGYLIYKDVAGNQKVLYTETRTISIRDAAVLSYNTYDSKANKTDSDQKAMKVLRSFIDD